MESIIIFITKALIYSRFLTVASATLVIYDHVITFDQEVALFWSGPRDASRILYLAIRYLGSIQALIAINLHFGVSEDTVSIASSHHRSRPHADSQHSFKVWLAANVVLINMGAAMCQAVITLRVWYLFMRHKIIRSSAVLLYIACTSSTWALTGTFFGRLLHEMEHPNTTKNPSILAVLYVPSFVIHTVLFALKIYRYMTSDRFQRRSSLLAGFLKEGLMMYACAIASLLYTIIALVLSNPSQLEIYVTGLQGGVVIGATIVSVCHALLSIRSLSATLHVDPAWLLNHAELSRVQWTKGDREGEIFVELQASNCAELPLVNMSRTVAPGVMQPSDLGIVIRSD